MQEQIIYIFANVENLVVTVIGDVDPVLVTSKVRKSRKESRNPKCQTGEKRKLINKSCLSLF